MAMFAAAAPLPPRTAAVESTVPSCGSHFWQGVDVHRVVFDRIQRLSDQAVILGEMIWSQLRT